MTALSTAPGAVQADPATEPVQVLVHQSQYLPGDDRLGAPVSTLYVPQGYGITVTNLEAVAAHSLTSDVIVDPLTGARLFDSGILNYRQPTSVQGVAALAPGTYRFHCSVHDYNMRGELVVLGEVVPE